MDKDFNDFISLMNSKDWTLVSEKISKNIKAIDLTHPNGVSFLTSEITRANIQFTLTILREYHEWINK